MPIIITRNGENAQKVERSSFQSEDRLQQYIHANPDAIPLYEIDEDVRLLILAREFSTSSGPIDALGIDEHGEVYLIETKLYKNSDKRMVVAQVLDYGAALAFDSTDFAEFLISLENHVSRGFNLSLKEKVCDFFGLTDEEYHELLNKVEINLDNGEFSFVVLMDTIDERLKNLIVFINQYSKFDIYGVEVEYYKHQEFEIIIPKLFGAEVKKSVASKSSASQRQTWDEERFFDKLKERLNSSEIATVRRVYSFAQRTADIIKWGSGYQKGSFNPVYEKVCPRSIFTVDTTGVLKINQHWMEETPEMLRYRGIIRAKMTAVLGLAQQTSVWAFYKEDWMPHTDEFMKAIEEIIA